MPSAPGVRAGLAPGGRRAAGLAVAACTVAIAVVLGWPADAPGERVRLRDPVGVAGPLIGHPAAAHAPAAMATPGPVAFVTGLESLPASLQGTEAPGGLAADAHGRLVVNRALRDVFDFVLSATGEEPAARLRARLAVHLARHLPPAAAAEALALADAYIAYKDGLAADLRGTPATTVADLRARVATLQAARARHFAPDVVRAFFGDEAAHDAYQLDRMAILRDASLSPEEKARRVTALRARQPDALQREADMVEVVDTLDTLTADWRARGDTPEALRQLRDTLVGPEAAGRLETLDRETEAWNHRVAAHLQRRARILSDAGLADPVRHAQVQALRREAFSAEERLRIETIERIEDSGTRDAPTAPRFPPAR